MNSYKTTITPFGPSAVIINWHGEVDEQLLNTILSFKQAVAKQFEGEFEIVPSYNSLTLISNVEIADFKSLKQQLQTINSKIDSSVAPTRTLWKLPVCYDAFYGIDLADLEEQLQLTSSDIIKLHTAQSYLVYGIGFLPGFMYLGGVPEQLITQRKAVPRLKVEKGAVGIAAKQTGIYPQESPGGWNIIGNCPIPTFSSSKEKPCFIEVGDKVQFYPVSKAEHEVFKIQDEVGIYQPENTKLNA